MVLLVEKWKQKQSEHQQNDSLYKRTAIQNINNIKANYDQIIRQTESMIKDYAKLQQIRQLRYSKKIITIRYHDELDQYKRLIQRLQQNNEQYEICIDFGYISNSLYSIASKMELLEMIDTVSANSRVGSVAIRINFDN